MFDNGRAALDLWETARGKLLEEFGDELFDRWIAGLSLLSAEADRIDLGVPNLFVLDWIRARYMPRITRVCRDVFGDGSQFNLSVDPELFRQRREDQKGVIGKAIVPPGAVGDHGGRHPGDPWSAKGLAGPGVRPATRPGDGAARLPESTLDNFVIGSANELAGRATAQVLAGLGRLYNPLFVFGGSGVGKTHLLRGIFRRLKGSGKVAPRREKRVGKQKPARRPETLGSQIAASDLGPLKVRYVTGEQFFNHFVASVQDHSVHKFRETYRSLDVLVLDDVQHLASKKKTQLELLHTLDALVETGHQVVVASHLSPRRLDDLDPGLISRFLGGLVVRLERPDYATRLGILQNRARQLGSGLDDKVLECIAEHVRGDAHELTGALMQLDVRVRIPGARGVDIETTRAVLAERERVQRSVVTIERIHQVVAEHFSLDPEPLVSRNGQRHVSHARQVAMYLARKCTDASLATIGKYFGNRKHTTVKCSVTRIDRLLEASRSGLFQDLQSILERLENA